MTRLGRSIRNHVERASGVERFVQLLVGGGVALVAGLWVLVLVRPWSVLWLAGGVLVALGVAGLTGGIRREIDY